MLELGEGLDYWVVAGFTEGDRKRDLIWVGPAKSGRDAIRTARDLGATYNYKKLIAKPKSNLGKENPTVAIWENDLEWVIADV